MLLVGNVSASDSDDEKAPSSSSSIGPGPDAPEAGEGEDGESRSIDLGGLVADVGTAAGKVIGNTINEAGSATMNILSKHFTGNRQGPSRAEDLIKPPGGGGPDSSGGGPSLGGPPPGDSMGGGPPPGDPMGGGPMGGGPPPGDPMGGGPPSSDPMGGPKPGDPISGPQSSRSKGSRIRTVGKTTKKSTNHANSALSKGKFQSRSGLELPVTPSRKKPAASGRLNRRPGKKEYGDIDDDSFGPIRKNKPSSNRASVRPDRRRGKYPNFSNPKPGWRAIGKQDDDDDDNDDKEGKGDSDDEEDKDDNDDNDSDDNHDDDFGRLQPKSRPTGGRDSERGGRGKNRCRGKGSAKKCRFPPSDPGPPETKRPRTRRPRTRRPVTKAPPPETTTSAPETTTSPPKATTSPPETTTSSPETTTAEPSASPDLTPAPGEAK